MNSFNFYHLDAWYTQHDHVENISSFFFSSCTSVCVDPSVYQVMINAINCSLVVTNALWMSLLVCMCVNLRLFERLNDWLTIVYKVIQEQTESRRNNNSLGNLFVQTDNYGRWLFFFSSFNSIAITLFKNDDNKNQFQIHQFMELSASLRHCERCERKPILMMQFILYFFTLEWYGW